jgi:hypothetical protein
MNRSRLNIYVEAEHVRRLRELAATQGVSKSAVIATALASFLSPEGQERREAAFARRLDRLSGQFERLERDQSILIETLALFIRYEFSIATSVPEAHQEAARAQGKARFEKFVEQLARHIQRGGSLVRDLHTEIYPDEKLFFSDEPDSTGSSGMPS